MRALQITETGGPEVLESVEMDTPTPGEGQALVEIAAIGVNFIDTNHRRGAYPLDLPKVIGLEAAGTVVDVGPGVTIRSVGDRVAWAGQMGSYADHAVVDPNRTVVVPDAIDLELAAAVMLQGMTAHYLTHSTYALSGDDTALVYAPAGGVGRLLIQLAKRRGARVIACTSTPQKGDIARGLGADDVIVYGDEDIPTRVRELTDGQGVEVVYDSVGQATFEDSLSSLKRRGLMVLYGQASGPVPPLNLRHLNEAGSLFITRPTLAHYTATTSELEWRAGALFEQMSTGQLDVVIHERYPFERAADAHRDIESQATTGKLLIIP